MTGFPTKILARLREQQVRWRVFHCSLTHHLKKNTLLLLCSSSSIMRLIWSRTCDQLSAPTFCCFCFFCDSSSKWIRLFLFNVIKGLFTAECGHYVIVWFHSKPDLGVFQKRPRIVKGRRHGSISKKKLCLLPTCGGHKASDGSMWCHI